MNINLSALTLASLDEIGCPVHEPNSVLTHRIQEYIDAGYECNSTQPLVVDISNNYLKTLQVDNMLNFVPNLCQLNRENFVSMLQQYATELDANANRIVALDGINSFKALTKLNMSQNSIRRLDNITLSQFESISSNLTELDLSHNNINVLDTLSLPLLRVLKLKDNLLVTMPNLTKLSSLESLDLSYNSIIDITFEDLTMLPGSMHTLLISNNNIKTDWYTMLIGISALRRSLRYLAINSNPFSEVNELKAVNLKIYIGWLLPYLVEINNESFTPEDNKAIQCLFRNRQTKKLNASLFINKEVHCNYLKQFCNLSILNETPNTIVPRNNEIQPGISILQSIDRKISKLALVVKVLKCQDLRHKEKVIIKIQRWYRQLRILKTVIPTHRKLLAKLSIYLSNPVYPYIAKQMQSTINYTYICSKLDTLTSALDIIFSDMALSKRIIIQIQSKSAIKIQSMWRMFTIQKQFKPYSQKIKLIIGVNKKCCVHIQRIGRCYIARLSLYNKHNKLEEKKKLCDTISHLSNRVDYLESIIVKLISQQKSECVTNYFESNAPNLNTQSNQGDYKPGKIRLKTLDHDTYINQQNTLKYANGKGVDINLRNINQSNLANNMRNHSISLDTKAQLRDYNRSNSDTFIMNEIKNTVNIDQSTISSCTSYDSEAT